MKPLSPDVERIAKDMAEKDKRDTEGEQNGCINGFRWVSIHRLLCMVPVQSGGRCGQTGGNGVSAFHEKTQSQGGLKKPA
jgi:hypothetical protein